MDFSYLPHTRPLAITVIVFQLANGYSRKYSEKKLQENLDSEIMEVLLSEAREAYAEEIIVELTSNTADEMESNVARIESWLEQWKKDRTS